MCFFRNGSSYNFETSTIVISMPENLRVHLSLALKIQRKVMFYSKMCFFRNGSTYSFETCSNAVGMPGNLSIHLFWPSKYKGKWCFIPKCVFAETDHHTALKLGPLQLTHLKTSGSAGFGPLNTKESDVLFQNVFSQKWIIIQLWNQYHWDQHAWKPQGTLEFGLLNTKESDVLFQNVFFFFRNGPLYNFETCTNVIGMPGNLSMHLVWPSKYKGKWCFIPKCVFSEMDHHTTLKPVPLGSACLKTPGYTWVWPSKYKGKWCFISKCVFSQMDHCITLRLVPL